MTDLFAAPSAPQMLKFFIPIEPRGKGRPRTRVVHANGHSFASTYTDAKTKKYEAELARFAIDAKRTSGWKVKEEIILNVEMKAFFLIPKSYSKRDRLALDGRPAANRIDCDNLCKSVLDALNNVIYLNDKCVTGVKISKQWVSEFDKQGVEVTVTECG